MNNFLFYFTFIVCIYSQDVKFFDESFDPLNLVEPDLKLPIIIRTNDNIPQNLTNFIPDSIVDGFRIQVVSTNDLNLANSMANEIKEKFSFQAYIIFDSPNYKLRLGDFNSRKNAELIKKDLVKNGYNKSWIIRTKVLKK